MRRKAVTAIIVLLVVAASFVAGNWYNKEHAADKKPSRRIVYYVDPTDPSIKYDKPGFVHGLPLAPVYVDERPMRQ